MGQAVGYGWLWSSRGVASNFVGNTTIESIGSFEVVCASLLHRLLFIMHSFPLMLSGHSTYNVTE